MRRDKTERLLNLVFALMGTQGSMSRSEIRSTVAGYESSESDEAFERMFERDKDELRSMGIPVETVFDAFGDALGYVIAPDSYAYIDLQLTSRDLTVLSIATQVWDKAVLGRSARTAMRKIEAKTDKSVTNSPLIQGVARVRAQDGAIIPLMNAAREKKVVKFLYRAPGHESEKRSIEPWAVICRNGNWYVVGHDQDRGEERTFKLTRIQGSVNVSAQPHTQDPPHNRTRTVELPPEESLTDATICVSAGRGGSLMRHAHNITSNNGIDVIKVKASRAELITWMLSSANAINSVEPQGLREDLLASLECLATAHELGGLGSG